MTSTEICRKLGYTEDWICAGVITRDYLQRQWSIFCDSDDKNQEHYRVRATRDYLDQKKEFSTEEIDRFLELEDQGPDGCNLSVDRAIQLLEHPAITDQQYSSLCGHPIFSNGTVKKRYERMRIKRSVGSSGIFQEIRAIQESEDGPSHELMLENSETPLEAIDWLSQHGRNKGIRNRAKIRLKKMIKAQQVALRNPDKPVS